MPVAWQLYTFGSNEVFSSVPAPVHWKRGYEKRLIDTQAAKTFWSSFTFLGTLSSLIISNVIVYTFSH